MSDGAWSAFLAATGLAGFLASVVFDAAGLKSMTIRYPAAVAVAYLVFLGLPGMDVSYRRGRRRNDPATGGRVRRADDRGHRADPAPGILDLANAIGPHGGGSGGGGGGGPGLDGADGDGLVILPVILLIVAAVGSALLARLFLPVQAPVLLAEVLVDGVLLAGLARRLRVGRSPHRASGVYRRTAVPLLAVILCFAAVGYDLGRMVPGATTMGEAVRLARSRWRGTAMDAGWSASTSPAGMFQQRPPCPEIPIMFHDPSPARLGRRSGAGPRSLVVAAAAAMLAVSVLVAPAEAGTAFDVATEVMMEDVLAQLLIASDELERNLIGLGLSIQVSADGTSFSVKSVSPLIDDQAQFTPAAGSTTPGVGTWTIVGGIGAPIRDEGSQTVSYSGGNYVIDSDYTYRGTMYDGLKADVVVGPDWSSLETYYQTFNGVSEFALLGMNRLNTASGQWSAQAGPLEGPIAFASGNVIAGTATGTSILPEPSGWAMLVLGLLGAAGLLRRSRKDRPMAV